MPQIWCEIYDSTRHRDRMNWGWGAPTPEQLDRHLAAPTLEPHTVVFVRVVGFTFEFHSVQQIAACHAYYAQKHHPTSRLPVGQGDYGGDQGETQRWFERLPLFLREEPKRIQVVAALDEALHRIAAGKLRLAAV